MLEYKLRGDVMDREILEILKSIQSDVKDLKTDVKDLKIDVSKLKTDVSELKIGQNKIEEKLDAVHYQTAELTEFMTETKGKLNSISNGVTDLRKDITNVEIITSSNWNDIAKLKAVK